MFSTKAEYGVRVMAHLARRSDDRVGEAVPISLAAIAEAEGLPLAYLEHLVARLRRADLVESRRGAHGGYRFAMPTEEITVLDVVEILDGEVRPARCSAGGVCYIKDAPLCATSKVWDEARVALEGVFGRYSIAGLAAVEREERRAREAASVTP